MPGADSPREDTITVMQINCQEGLQVPWQVGGGPTGMGSQTLCEGRAGASQFLNEWICGLERQFSQWCEPHNMKT